MSIGVGAIALVFGIVPVRAAITGDCSNTGMVAINNVQNCVNIYLTTQALSSCPNCDQNANGNVEINEVQGAVNCYLDATAANCPKVTPVASPTSNVPTPTATNTNTSAPTSTNTPVAPTPTNTLVPTPSNTVPPAPTATSTPSHTPVPSVTNTVSPTITPGGVAVCGNGIKESGEDCDDGGTCVGGSTSDPTHLQKCPSNVSGGVDCAGGNTCKPFGGDGCAINCTSETTVHFAFTGAKCFGGASNGKACTLQRTCIGGSFPNKPCVSNADCGIAPNQGVCTSECALDSNNQPTNDGSNCFGVGVCTAGTKVGQVCPFGTGTVPPIAPVSVCQSGPKAGIACSADADCGGVAGSCANSCGTNGVCSVSSGATLNGLGSVIAALAIGPLIGGEDLVLGKAGADGMIPVAVPAASVQFNPVKVPGLACACPRGVAAPDINGPGNSGSGYINCGMTALNGIDLSITVDHNTTPSHASNGPGTCAAGTTRAGLACGADADCGTGSPAGSCANSKKGGGICVDGANQNKVCHADSDCPDSICNSPDDATCTNADPPPPAGSGTTACKETKTICTSGPLAGTACKFNSDCGGSSFYCGNACNAISPHTNVCNSPRHLRAIHTGGLGSAVILSNTAIGTILDATESGNCSRAGKCTTFAQGTTPVGCQVDAECGAGKVCSSAYCAGICSSGTNVGKSCLAATDCGTGGVCQPGANYGKGCTGVGTCGANNICVAVSDGKGFDGLPCTDDDAPSAKGTAAVLPSTTGTAASGIVDASNGGNPGPTMIWGSTCTGKSFCQTSAQGSLFSCNAGTPAQMISGASLALAFPNLDQASVSDNVVTTKLTAK
ncbi:MAG TPA: hypothetical protein VMW17_15785 [Candidatus Binatia bacterium]|nr:hypothetical protein [Candidatus Binatia bacterium]